MKTIINSPLVTSSNRIFPAPSAPSPSEWVDIRCPVCAELFSTNATDPTCPMSLECGHSLCRKCLQTLPCLSCPSCRKPMSTNVADSAPVNFLAINLLSFVADVIADRERRMVLSFPQVSAGLSLGSSNSGVTESCGVESGDEVPVGVDESIPFRSVMKLTCYNCSRKVATSYCDDCKVNLCADCDEEAHKMMMFKSHKRRKGTSTGMMMVYKDGFNSEIFEESVYCPHHREEKVKLFCETCQMMICLDCAHDLTGGLHSKHAIVVASKAREIFLEKMVEECKEHFDSLTKQHVHLRNCQSEIVELQSKVSKILQQEVFVLTEKLKNFDHETAQMKSKITKLLRDVDTADIYKFLCVLLPQMKKLSDRSLERNVWATIVQFRITIDKICQDFVSNVGKSPLIEHYLEYWRKGINLGDLIDVSDGTHWFAASVVEIQGDHLLTVRQRVSLKNALI